MTSAHLDARDADAARAAHDHLWMHFARLSAYERGDVPVIVRGSGPYIWERGFPLRYS